MIEFPEEEYRQRQSIQERRYYWQRTKCLHVGSLVCLRIPIEAVEQQGDNKFTTIFAHVFDRQLQDLVPYNPKAPLRVTVKCFDAKAFAIAADYLKLISIDRDVYNRKCNDFDQMQSRIDPKKRQNPRSSIPMPHSLNPITMLQFESVVFSYEAVLASLQSLHGGNVSSLMRLLSVKIAPFPTVAVPRYLRANNSYNLLTLLPKNFSGDNAVMERFRTANIHSTQIWDFIAKHCVLDRPQLDAFKAALMNEVSLTQGPPGTGKSFLGVKLVVSMLANMKDDDPPILCICYTNHALDQFLEGLLDHDITNIIRMGGRSRSERLKEKNIRLVSYNEKSIHTKRMGASEYAMHGSRKKLNALSELLHAESYITEWGTFLEYLEEIDEFSGFMPALRTVRGLRHTLQLLPKTGDDEEEKFDDQPPDTENPWNLHGGLNPLKFWIETEHHRGFERNDRDLLLIEKLIKLQGKFKENISRAEKIGRKIDHQIVVVVRKVVAHIAIFRNKASIPLGELIGEIKSMLFTISTYKTIRLLDSKSFRVEFLPQLRDMILLPESNLNVQFKYKFDPNVIFNNQKDEQDLISHTSSLMAGMFRLLRQEERCPPGALMRVVDQRELLSASPTILLKSDASGDRVTVNKANIVPASDSNRSLRLLLEDKDVWRMSQKERKTLLSHFLVTMRQRVHEDILKNVKVYQKELALLRELQRNHDLTVLRKARVIGVTTTGAATNNLLLNLLGAKICIVEEASEINEGHILSALSRSTEHLVLIGDHLQLRPKPQVYALSIESRTAYNLDVSLFERLAEYTKGNFPITALSKQWRMRPEIADLARCHLYPKLQDAPAVLERPRIRGFKHNVFFFNHEHRETGSGNADGEDLNSKSNPFEVEMTIRLVKYLVAQGYDLKDITVLTPYNGQLKMLFDALQPLGYVKISELDESEIAKVRKFESSGLVPGAVEDFPAVSGLKESSFAGGTSSEESPPEKDDDDDFIPVKSLLDKKKDDDDGSDGNSSDSSDDFREAYYFPDEPPEEPGIRLSSVDNFQGEESKIIILSLVRNNADCVIGFLNTFNRVNVMLTRAKEGMFILGNKSSLLAHPKTPIWPKVMEKLASRNQIGNAFELSCQIHPKNTVLVQTPQEFDSQLEKGVCSERCGEVLPCGHSCPRNCHSDDPFHKAVKCFEPCNRRRDHCDHPCKKICGTPCELCQEQIMAFQIPACGHKVTVRCHQTISFEGIKCLSMIDVTMPTCGHTVSIKCNEKAQYLQDPKRCTAKCGSKLECGHICQAECGACLKSNSSEKSHPPCKDKCRKPRRCGHPCTSTCHPGVSCNKCTEQKCVTACSHSKCPKNCEKPCQPCMSSCDWSCEHGKSCLLPCGFPCIRALCNEPCSKKLTCGHSCPSLCGEVCPDSKIACPFCVTNKSAVIGSSGITIESWTPNMLPLVALPCKHVFLLPELDQHFQLASLYQDSSLILKSSSSGLSGTFIPAPCCPVCFVPVFKINRYKRLCNISTLNASTAKILTELEGDLIRYRCGIRSPRDVTEKLQLLKPIIQKSYSEARLVDLWKQSQSKTDRQFEILQYPIQDDFLHAVRTWIGFAECQVAVMRCRGLYSVYAIIIIR